MFKARKLNLEKQGLHKVFGPLELRVMDVLWEQNKALSAREVTNQLAKSGGELAFNSVNTILNRLCQKSLVHKSGQTRTYVFAFAYSRAEMITASRRDILSSVLQDPVLFGAHAFETSRDELDEATKQQLRKLL